MCCLVAVLMRYLCCLVVRPLLLHIPAWCRCWLLHIAIWRRCELLTPADALTAGVVVPRLRIADAMFSCLNDDHRLILHILLLQGLDPAAQSVAFVMQLHPVDEVAVNLEVCAPALREAPLKCPPWRPLYRCHASNASVRVR
jgi:hypothetical protein